MYYNSYEEYMRDVLGYTRNRENSNNTYYDNYYSNRNNSELENMYPEIYKILYPMVCKITSNTRMPLTAEQLEKMVDEIYECIEKDENETRKGTEVKIEVRNNSKTKTQEIAKETEEKRSRPNNYTLRDLIKILILRELLGNRRPGMRPNMPNNRPPYPPRPGMGRPPFPMRNSVLTQGADSYINDLYF